MQSSKIVVLGGYGEMGTYIVRDLFRTCESCDIIIAGRDGSKAKDYARSFNSSRVRGIHVDVENHKDLVRILKGATVCINAVVYRYNLHVMKACLDAGCHYLDLGGLFHMTKKQLKLHNDFKKKNLVAILGCGSTPGITNVMAGYGSKFLDRIDEIKVTFADYSFIISTQHFTLPYSAYTLFDEFTEKPAVFTKGKMKFVDAMTGKEYFDFPKPIGRVSGYYTLHSELATFPESFKKKGLKECSFRVTFGEDFVHDVKLLIEAGLASKNYIRIGGHKVRPIDVTAKELNRLLPHGEIDDLEYVRVLMVGKKSGKKVELILDAIAYSDKRAHTPAGTVDTAVPPSIIAQMIADGKVKDRGVLPPESCINPNIFFKELSKRGIKVIKRTRRID